MKQHGATPPARFDVDALRSAAAEMLHRAGLARTRAGVVAEVLVEGDLFGHTTHGLQLLAPYLASLEAGTMEREGEPAVVKDTGSTLAWDGRYLPGPWLVKRALNLAQERVLTHGVVSLTVQRSHHIGCLQAYLKEATDAGLLLLLLSSDPSTASVAPHGGRKALYTPNPIAVGIPTSGDPILIDISTSTTSNGLSLRLQQEGRRFPAAWAKDADGTATSDPAALFTDPPGSLLPLGEVTLGHKGFALGIWVEVMTSALGGYGRAERPARWGASVFIQLIDPAVFGGAERFLQETTWLADSCRACPVGPGEPPVRLPGEAGLKRRAEQIRDGLQLYPGILESLQPWAAKLGVHLPEPF